MALYIKLRTKNEPDIHFNRFKSAFKIFDYISKKLIIEDLKIAFFLYEPLKEFNKDFKYKFWSFGILFKEYLKLLQELKYTERNFAGFELIGTFVVKDKTFKFSYTLNPKEYSEKGNFDIRFEILPNLYAEVLEDIEKYTPIKEVIHQQIKEYNQIEKKDYPIRKAILSEYEEEYRQIHNWNFFYTIEPISFLKEIFQSSKELKEILEYGEKNKFSRDVFSDEDFILLLDKYSQEYNVGIAGGSITVLPKNKKQMNEFIGKLSGDLLNVASKIYKKPDEVKKIISTSFRQIG